MNAPKPTDHDTGRWPPPGGLLDDLLGRATFPEAGTAVRCAVSGGPDSLALLVLAAAHGLDVEAVHVDHGLRPGSADEADVVAEVAALAGARFRSETVDVGDGPNLEERCRIARRAVLGPDALTGHTADDQAETLLVNLLRGTGLAGLGAMQAGPTHPLLAIRRSETHALCADLGLSPVVDPTNMDPRFQRNRLRHEVMPLLNEVAQRDVVPLLVRTSDHAREADALLGELASALDPTDCGALRAVHPLLAATALRVWLRDGQGHPPGQADIDRVMAVVRLEAVACELSGGRRVARTAGQLRIEHPSTT